MDVNIRTPLPTASEKRKNCVAMSSKHNFMQARPVDIQGNVEKLKDVTFL
jgi:hypothetical protein